MSDAACILRHGSMSCHYHQKIARANKCEIGTDFSPQLLVLISPAILSNVHPLLPFKLWKQTSALRDTKNLRSRAQHVCIYFTHMTQQSFLVPCTCMRLDQMSIQYLKDNHQ